MLIFKCSVDYDIVKLHTLALERLQHLLVGRKEVGCRERRCAESVLVGHHHKFKIESRRNEMQVAQHAGNKFQFLKRIHLKIHRRLNDKRSVAVDEQRAFLIFHNL